MKVNQSLVSSPSVAKDSKKPPKPMVPPITKNGLNNNSYASSWRGSSVMEKLPNQESLESLQVGSVMTHHYFGDNARLKFFERYRQLKNQSLLTLTSSKQPLEKLYFEKDRPVVAASHSKIIGMSNSQYTSSYGAHGPLMAGDSEYSDPRRNDSSFFLTTGAEAFDESSYHGDMGSDFREDFDEEDSVFDHLESVNGRVTFQRSQTDTSLIIPNMSLIHKTKLPLKRRPVTAPNRDRSRSPSAQVFRTNEEKKPDKKLPPKPVSASSGRKIYKFDGPELNSLNPLSARSGALTSRSTTSKYRLQNFEFGNQSSVVSASTSRAKSANPLARQSSRYTFVRRGSANSSAGRKKSPKKKSSISLMDGSSSPFKGNHLEQDDNRSITTGTSASSDWLLRNEHLNTNDDYTELGIASPRTKFLANCINEGMNPRASLVLRKNISKRLELQHQGMGDKMAVSLANSVRDLPFVESINIADNMLTDDGIGPIILAAVDIPTLTELNISQNIIGPVSSRALYDYLISEDCTLKILVLNNADVDDFECSGFIEAVKQNKSLRELDLSRNLIGKAENLNTVKGDIITGSEAIADLLRSPECNLTKLQLQWNMIRLDGAIDLASSLSINSTLVYLDLSFNSLSTDGGIVLGVSILRNRTLQTLILSNNSIDAKACFTICAGIIENRSLRRVVLDGNPIGEQGMRALMLVPILAGNRVRISASKCNATIKDPKCWFNFDQVVRDYRLNMEDGYERAIAIILLHIIAGHQTFSFQKFDHETKSKAPPTSARADKPKSQEGGLGKAKSVELVQVMIKEDQRRFDDRQKHVLKELNKVCESASDLKKAGALFHEFDLNGNGALEEDELRALLRAIGLDISPRRLKELLDKFDADGDHCLEIFEFIMLLRSLHQEAYHRMQEMKYSPAMVLASSVSSYDLHQSSYVPSSVLPYSPPEQGFLRINISDDLVHKRHYRILTSCQREYILHVVKTAGSSTLIVPMISAAVEHIKLRLEEALNLAEIMLKESHDKLEIARNLLFQIDSSNDAGQFLHSLFGYNRAEMARLKREFGMLLRCILGNPTGYYCLDLTKLSHRKCLNKLSAISASQGSLKKEYYLSFFPGGNRNLGDISQKGNYSLFRNEMYNGKPITISPAFCSPVPLSGKLEFDFSCHLKPAFEDMPMSDERIIRLLIRYFLLDPKDVGVALQKLFDSKVKSEIQLGCNGVMSATEVCSMERMKEITEHIDNFYNQLPIRWHLYEESMEKMSRPVTEVHGKIIELFERDKFPIPSSITNEYRRIEDAKDEEHRAILQSMKRKLSTVAAKGLRQRRRSLIISPNAAESDEDESSSSESEQDDYMDDNHSLLSSLMEKRDGSVEEKDSKGEGGGENEEDTLENEKDIDLHAISFHSLKLRTLSTFSQSRDDHIDKAPTIQIRTASQQFIEHEDDEDSFVPQKPAHDLGEVLDEIEQLKEIAVKKQRRDLAKQKRLMEEQDKYFQNKSVEKVVAKRQKILSRRNACCENYNTVQISAYEQDFFSKLRAYFLSSTVQTATKANRIVDLLEEVFSRSWIYSRHLALILECFVQFGYLKQTKYFGTFRVEIAVLLFSRVIDLHNIEFVLNVMSPFEAAAFICRIGYLNIFNPCKPEGAWELDLSRREERVVAKILIGLALQEPGENWIHQGFRWSRTTEAVPGWELTEGWITEEGLPNRGLIWLTYYSGEGKGRRHCKPNVPFRKSLLNLVLLDEKDIINEENRLRPPKGMLAGEVHFHSNRNIWENFLAPLSRSKA